MWGRKRRRLEALAARTIEAYQRHETPDLVGPIADVTQPHGAIPRVYGLHPPSTLTAPGGFESIVKGIDAYKILGRDLAESLGEDHPAVLVSQANLHVLVARWGGHRDAMNTLPMLDEQVGAVLGARHISALAIRRDLGALHCQFGSVEAGISWLDEVVSDLTRQYGETHPDTLMAVEARVVAQARIEPWIDGQLVELREIQNFMDRWSVGEQPRMEEPDYAELRAMVSPPEEVIARCEDVVSACQSHLGPDHPVTLSARHSLITWRREAGEGKAAADASLMLLADRWRALGPDHPDTFVSRISVLRDEHQDEAVLLIGYEAYLVDAIPALGRRHPMTLALITEIERLRAA